MNGLAKRRSVRLLLLYLDVFVSSLADDDDDDDDDENRRCCFCGRFVGVIDGDGLIKCVLVGCCCVCCFGYCCRCCDQKA